jgi:hypothetical protein
MPVRSELRKVQALVTSIVASMPNVVDACLEVAWAAMMRHQHH